MKKNKKSRIQYLLILDQSGSMHSIKDEVINSYNEQLEYLTKLNKENKVLASLSTFNDEIKVHALRESPSALFKLTEENYEPDSCTALYDAMGISIMEILKGLKKQDKLFITIFTDGMENASKYFNEFQVNMLTNKLKKDGHTISFICKEKDEMFYKEKFNIEDDCMFSISESPLAGEVSESFGKVQRKMSQIIDTN